MKKEDPKDPLLIFQINKTYATCATKSDESSLCLLDVKVTNVKDLERWLLDNNNKQVGRAGSEFRTVSKEMGYTTEQESNENEEKPKIAY